MIKRLIIFCLTFIVFHSCLSPVLATPFSLKSKAKTSSKKMDIDKINDVIPAFKYDLIKYNVPAGSRELNLNAINLKRQLNLNAVASPDMSLLAYTEVYFYPQTNITGSSIYLIPLNRLLLPAEKILKASIEQKNEQPVVEFDISKVESFQFKTYTVVDWNPNGDKILIKEKNGKNYERMYSTSLLVYDLKDKSVCRLDEIRDAIEYFWRNKDLNLDNYVWDIKPLGWDSNNPERIIIEAFGMYKNQKKFLGIWAVDYKGSRSYLLSLDKNTKFGISQNGFCLEILK